MHGLCWQIKELSAAFIETANQLEKTNRDKVQLISELEVVRSHLDNNDVDYSKATNSMKMSVTHATIERNATVKEAARCKQRVIDAKWEADEERERLTSDRNDLKRRLAKAEQELVDTKEQISASPWWQASRRDSSSAGSWRRNQPMKPSMSSPTFSSWWYVINTLHFLSFS